MEYFVYLLRSYKTGKYYLGQTQDIETRLLRHNSGDSFSTRKDRPWEIVYTEKYSSQSEAMRRESFLKSPAGWKELQTIKQKIQLKMN
ncbi:MAG: GIY-YIG nuclease family protein [Ignavibacteriae bacterium]|nr:GIY-YIG nuclease family protein [Ignavibacteriota bacterium]